jgi:hypothetical protein
MTFDFGPVRRWKEGDILFAANDLLTMAYVATDDPEKLSGWATGLHCPDQMCVSYISHEQARAWDDRP